jgi:phospholipid/cholesterol/gamma-HCH transport system substrate-binding protein
MRRFFTKYGRWLTVLAVLAVVSLAIGGYISVHQHLKLPGQNRYIVNAEFSTSSGLTPGLAQPVNVAGVRVGTITDATLKNGRSVVKMEVDPAELKHVYNDAHAVLVPNTALKDMQVQIYPGQPGAGVLKDGGTIPVARTSPPIDSDELTNALDADTRDFFQLLVGGFDQGLRGRGHDLRNLLKALGPTAKELRPISDALAARHVEIRRLTHNLSVLSKVTATKDSQLATLVDASNATLGALASQDAALRSSISKLPGTLAATRNSLHHTTTFANQLGPTLTALLPTAKKLPATLKATKPLLDTAEPVLRTQLRPFVREVQPLAKALSPTVRDLSAVTPSLTSAFHVLNYVANELAYNPSGDNEGFLFWLAWFAHNSDSFLSTADAHGSVWRGLGLISCWSLKGAPGLAPVVEAITGVVPAC